MVDEVGIEPGTAHVRDACTALYHCIIINTICSDSRRLVRLLMIEISAEAKGSRDQLTASNSLEAATNIEMTFSPHQFQM